MDLIKTVRTYVEKMITQTSGMKILLLDADTTPVVSVVTTQSTLLEKETYLVDRVDNRQRDKMKHLKCVCFVRPTADSIQALVDELRDPRYSKYYLFFSNTLKKSMIERLAEVDQHEVVQEVQEFFADYIAVNPDLFSLNMIAPRNPIYADTVHEWDPRALQRTTEGLMGVLLSLKRKPLIRYERMSAMAKKLGEELNYAMHQEPQLFDLQPADTPPILLLVDRRNDPVTPLLLQWTYQAMVHEILGINNGRVDMSGVPDIQPDLKEIVLSVDQDPFFRKFMFSNWGDLGASIKEYADEYQRQHKSTMRIESVQDMKRFVEEYPEFRKLSGNVSKHVTLVGELYRLQLAYKLLEVSELEQNLACNESHASDLRALEKMIADPKIREENKLRLTLLYALRYEKSGNNSIQQLVELLQHQGISDHKTTLIAAVLAFTGADQRQGDLFQNQDIFARGRNVLKGLKAKNVFTRHEPLLAQTLDQILKGRLKDVDYPFVQGGSRDRPQEVIVFFVGGATYAEARLVSQLNASTPGVRVVLGGTNVINSASFLDEIQDVADRVPGTGRLTRRPSAHRRSGNWR
ncbi:Sec1-like protein [Thamnocephalis sphaerospora]|uniref:Sec1-like protein n=1 Tax=Thamnocephalis sphaerospora TaxID=78915 RepID=A0A4P9XLV6_9FUNG|nr:Sec1-like protein [Thamnocephalis sphaerospora]|eukprot:RKP06825.1 Sec1-like protein [Thamnocephalis sphaerospora]